MNSSAKVIFKDSLPVLVLCAAISVGAGLALEINAGLIRMLPGILVSIPSFNQINGAISSVFSSRISSALHIGTIKPIIHPTKTLTRNVFASLLLALMSFSSFSLIAWGFNSGIGTVVSGMLSFLAAITVAGLITTSVLILLSVIFSYAAFRRNMDPDNIVIPVLTSIGDLLGIVLLFIISSLIL